jgi:hypothetical protein
MKKIEGLSAQTKRSVHWGGNTTQKLHEYFMKADIVSIAYAFIFNNYNDIRKEDAILVAHICGSPAKPSQDTSPARTGIYCKSLFPSTYLYKVPTNDNPLPVSI